MLEITEKNEGWISGEEVTRALVPYLRNHFPPGQTSARELAADLAAHGKDASDRLGDRIEGKDDTHVGTQLYW